jgi:hypothetical protein
VAAVAMKTKMTIDDVWLAEPQPKENRKREEKRESLEIVD